MSLPNQIVMPADGAANPFTIPGTTRKYSCAAGAAISVVGDDALVLLNNGWIGGSSLNVVGSGATAARPAKPQPGNSYNDTTVGGLVIYAGSKTGWVHHSTGASA